MVTPLGERVLRPGQQAVAVITLVNDGNVPMGFGVEVAPGTPIAGGFDPETSVTFVSEVLQPGATGTVQVPLNLPATSAAGPELLRVRVGQAPAGRLVNVLDEDFFPGLLRVEAPPMLPLPGERPPNTPSSFHHAWGLAQPGSRGEAMTPQWMTAERLSKLAELCKRDDHRCLKRHVRCPEKSHYQWATPRQEVVAVPVQHPVLDKDTGGIRRDITRPGWSPEQVTVWEWEPAYLHQATVEETKASWKADDRELWALDWKREQRTLHDGTYGSYGSQFDPVARDVFMAQRPEYYLKATGVDGVHFRPVAVVRVPSTNLHLFVDVSEAFVKPTKSQRRHARRHGKPVQEVTVEQLCQQAVQEWWTRIR